MNLVPTELNRRLSWALYNRVAAERSAIAGRSGFWRFVGIGIVGLGVGIAVGTGFYGYSFIRRSSDNLESLSAALSKALSNTQLRGTATGTVSIEPREIRLADGQTVKFDESSRVRLDPDAKVFADGELKVQAPSISVPPSASGPKSNSTPATITNFTIFKSVPFHKGDIMTGWKFLTSAQRAPTSQYCYYTESSENPGLDVVLSIANDMKLEIPKTTPPNFDVSGAFERCVWFKGDGR